MCDRFYPAIEYAVFGGALFDLPLVPLAHCVVCVALVVCVAFVDAVVGQVHEFVVQGLHGGRIPGTQNTRLSQ